MRSIICVVIVVALVSLAGCAKKDVPPADQSQTQQETSAESQPINSEDFESGDPENVVVPEEGSEDQDPPDTTP